MCLLLTVIAVLLGIENELNIKVVVISRYLVINVDKYNLSNFAASLFS